MELSLTTYNVFLRPRPPFYFDGQSERCVGLAEYLLGLNSDVLVLCEVFDHASREYMLRRLEPNYPHRTRLLGQGDSLWKGNGGVMILARWPIEREAQCLFGSASRFDDSLVNKGVTYARIRKGDMPAHVFGLHANAQDGAEAVRRLQLVMVRDFVDAMRISPDELVLIAGDFNVHRGRAREYHPMLKMLGALEPPRGGHAATYDPLANHIASDGTTPLILDYVLYLRHHRQPARAAITVSRPEPYEWRNFRWQKAQTELSDHYPVTARFEL